MQTIPSRPRNWLLTCFGFLITAGLLSGTVLGQMPDPQNVVLIVADDLGWRDLGFTGSDFYESPSLDALAERSMIFTQGYAACQVCSPSRVAIVTGKFPARLKTTDWFGAAAGTQWKRNTRLLPAEYRRSLPQEEYTLAEAFADQGYQTFFAGKWHMGGEGSLPEDHGFQINVGGHHRGSPPGGFFSPYQNPKMTDGEPGESLPIRLGKETRDFIRQHADRPFFAMLSFYSVHAPVQTRQTLWKKYRDKAVAQGLAEQRFIVDRTLQPVRQVQDHPIYAGMVESMDRAIGLVLQEIEDQGIADRTIVVFTSDNGGVSAGDASATSNLPLRGGKGRQWEGGIREPFLLSVPGKTTGMTNATPVISTDLYPTLLELAGIEKQPQQHLDGVSLVPLLNQGTLAARPLYWHYPHYGNQGGEPSAILRDGEWKLIHYFEDQRAELYHLPSDLGEQQDVSKMHPELVERMERQLLDWLKSIDANMPTANPNYDASQAETAMERLRTDGLQRMERQHARFLEADFEPNANWWGSKVPD